MAPAQRATAAQARQDWVPRILVVDDDPDVRRGLLGVLQGALHGVEILSAEDGLAALELLKRTPVDVLLTDYQMPRMDGLQLLHHARALQPRLACLMLTAHQDLEMAKEAVNEVHVHSFLTKPVEPRDVVRQVADALRQALQGRMQSELTAAQGEALREALALLQAQTRRA